MASVTNYILTYRPSDEDSIEDLNIELAKLTATPQRFQKVELEGRQLEHGVAVAALNYIYPSEVAKAMQAIYWRHPELVQLQYCGQEDDLFYTMYWAAQFPQ